MIVGWGIYCEIAIIWMSLDLTDDQSTLVQVMAWCRQVTRHYLSQCWPISPSSYGVTRPQWVNIQIICFCRKMELTNHFHKRYNPEKKEVLLWHGNLWPNQIIFNQTNFVHVTTAELRHVVIWSCKHKTVINIILYEGNVRTCLRALAAG